MQLVTLGLFMLPWLPTLAEHAALRAALAGGGALLIGLLLGPWMIARLKQRCGDPIVSPSPEIEKLHQSKRATPTMGGGSTISSTA